ncbi:hypothetical protein uvFWCGRAMDCOMC203_027 [Freshwater phage uvFW-CGR-AMD-COM-C203]|jgi:hypothetical protein|nr:hypothetical protein uvFWCGRAMDCOMC203_027 [Freshwater phage uvFW-CGR-AMD-COM-C203]
MKTIIDSTIEILSSMNLKANKVTTPPGYAGIQIDLPNDSQAFFVWSKMDDDDFHFRTARFWANDNPFSMWICPNLPEALAQTRVLIN